MPEKTRKVIIGVDTHKDFHHVAVIGALGEALADERFPTTGAGYADLMDWVAGHGEILRAGLEGTGSYGAGLAKRLRVAGITVIDVIAPDKQERRLRGKTDQIDAYSAARAVLSQRASTVPKTRDGDVEAIRVLHTAKKLVVKQSTETMNQLKAFLVCAPEALREHLAGTTGKTLAKACTRLRANRGDDTVTRHTKTALKSLGARYLALKGEAEALSKDYTTLIEAYAPELLDIYGVGPDVAATLLTVAGENVDRITSESALAHLCGTAPIPASSGKTNRYRLNRGGNRQGNAALHRIVVTRLKGHEETRAYMAKAIARGKTKREAMRLLKRYLCRPIYKLLTTIQERHATTEPANPIAA
jgi:transposase